MPELRMASGYAPRFGIVLVNYDTLERLPKQSAKWYSEAIAQNGLTE